MLNIDELIAAALKSNDQISLRTLRLLKTEIMKYKTAKNAKPYDNVVEIQIINKMCKQREESIEQYKQGNREDLVEKELEELNCLSQFLPKPVTEQEILSTLTELFTDGEILTIPKKNMGLAIKAVKEIFPTADGKMISDIVKSYLV